MSVSPILSGSSVASVDQYAELTRAAQAKRTASATAGSFNAAALRHASDAEQRAAVAQQFEAVLVRQLLGKTMTSMLGGEGGVAGSVYGDMLSDTFSQQLTAGSGLGLGRYIQQQLTPRGEKASAAASAETPQVTTLKQTF